MKIIVFAGEVDDDGFKSAKIAWPDEWGDLGVPCVIEAEGPVEHDETERARVKAFLEARWAAIAEREKASVKRADGGAE